MNEPAKKLENPLISDYYRQQNALLHEQRDDYGAKGKRWGNVVVEVCKGLETRDVLDYGCGKGSLRRSLPMVDVRNYDPAMPEWSEDPDPADVVTCLDVLEHIEPEKLDNVLAHIKSLARKSAIFVIATRPAIKRLPDGRNTHLIVENKMFWLNKLEEYMDLTQFNKTGDQEILAICAIKPHD